MKSLVLFVQIAFVAVVIGLWAAVSRMGAVDPTILPPPAKVAVALEALLRSNDFLADSLDTVIRVVAAFVIGAPIALAAGFVMGENIGVGRSLSPIFNLVFPCRSRSSSLYSFSYLGWASLKS